MSTNLWAFFILLFVEERIITVLSTVFRVGSITQLYVLVYSLSLFYMLSPVSVFVLCSFVLIGILFSVIHVACVCVEIYVTIILAIWSVSRVVLQM